MKLLVAKDPGRHQGIWGWMQQVSTDEDLPSETQGKVIPK